MSIFFISQEKKLNPYKKQEYIHISLTYFCYFRYLFIRNQYKEQHMIEKIRKVLSAGEGLKVEFKEETGGVPQNVYETVCSFSNSFGIKF